MRTSRIAVFAAFAAVSVAVAPMASAQSPNDAVTLLASGEKSLEAGKHSLAAQQFSRAMRSETLTSEQVAIAFYRRGQANRALGRHALAIADFNSALWISELPAAVQKEARDQRAQAYAALGRPDREQTTVAHGPSGSSSSSAGGPSVGAFETRVETSGAERQVTAAAPKPAPEPIGAFTTQVQAAPQSAPEPVTTASIPPSNPPNAPVPTPAPARAAAPAGAWSTSVDAGNAAPAAESQGEESSGRIGRFFSGLRGSILGSDDDAKAPEPSAQSAQPATRTASAAPTGQWSSSTSVGGAAPEQASSSGGRSYLLQLASVRSEADAQTAWQNISTKAQELVGSREPTIQKTELGSLGTVYRVQIGPFDDKRASLNLCNAFKASGVDCFLVTR